VATALGNLMFPYVYPDPESRRLRAALAEDSGLGSEYILAGCGADELIDLIMRLGSSSSMFYTL
jgi:histidinol-phosphate aminotransferase